MPPRADSANAKLTPCSENLDVSVWKICALFSPGCSVSEQFSPPIRDSSYISEEQNPQTDHFRLQPQPVSPPGALLRCPLSSPVTCTPAFLCPRSLRRPPRGCAQLCSCGDELWNPDGGRTAAGRSCDSDLLLLLLQDLCRAAPLPPLLPEHAGILFNSLFLPVVKHPYRHLAAAARTARCYPHIGSTTWLLKCQDVKNAVCKWREGAFNPPTTPHPNPMRIYKVWQD